MHTELYDKVLQLAVLAKDYNIGLNIDAEESERLEMSLELLERLCFEPALDNWKGIGFVIQAYQKRCFYVVDYVVDLASKDKDVYTGPGISIKLSALHPRLSACSN